MSINKPFSCIAVIPARGNSKRILNKNLIPINGKPLVLYTIEHALRSKMINEVYVSTDDNEIREVCINYGAKVIERPVELANDYASSESALLHVLNERDIQGLDEPDYIVFLQCTSPIRKDDDIDNAIQKMIDSKADSLLSVCENKRFLWKREKENAVSINYDYMNRQREQDMGAQFQENGSIYIMKSELLRESSNRLGKKIEFYEMNYWSSFQIDEPEDVELIEWLLAKKQHSKKILLSPKNIELIVFDFDGVMTDNTAYIDDKGKESVKVNRGDGMGISLLNEANYKMLVLSTEKNEVVKKRCEKLNIGFVQGVDDKLNYLKTLLVEKSINRENVIYVGNDVNDLSCMEYVGYPIAVLNSHAKIIEVSRYILSLSGGDGAVRELADWLLCPEQKTNISINN